MLDLTILAIGRMKNDNLRAEVAEFVKRLKPFARLEIIELPAAPFLKNSRERAKEIEGEQIINFLEKSAVKNNGAQRSVWLLAERGRSFSSPDFAAWLDKSQPLVLVVGGALGFSPELYRRYPQISLSPLTFPHELARTVLLEQIYRAATILTGKEYHY
jgi:23S rRNA (pseudouridine1915-N3)-methyltransferase